MIIRPLRIVSKYFCSWRLSVFQNIFVDYLTHRLDVIKITTFHVRIDTDIDRKQPQAQSTLLHRNNSVNLPFYIFRWHFYIFIWSHLQLIERVEFFESYFMLKAFRYMVLIRQ